MLNHFTWCELSVFDLSEAKCFYESVFAWEVGVREGNYHMCYSEESPSAGMHEVAWGTKGVELSPSWLPYVRVDSLHDMVNLALELGGKIEMHSREFMRGEKVMGNHALMRDPFGSRMMLYEGKDLGGQTDGRMRLSELHVDSLHRVRRFYEKLLGWKFKQDSNVNGRHLILDKKGEEAGSLFELDSELMKVESNWLVYFYVENMDATLQKVRQYGGLVIIDLTKENYGFALVQDSQGAFFCVRQN